MGRGAGRSDATVFAPSHYRAGSSVMNTKPIPVNPYLFVVGCPRSGTTLLRVMLDRHPQLAVSSDADFVVRFLDGYSEGDVPLTPRLVEEIIAYRRFRRMGLPSERVRELAAGVALYRDFASAIYSEYARAHGKERAGDKTPQYVEHLPLLHRLFPAAKVIHIIRDGRDVALSAVEWAPRKVRGPARFGLWQRDPIAVCALWWKSLVSAGMVEGQKLGPESYCEVRYEQLVAEPEQVLCELTRFLELPFAGEMLAGEGIKESRSARVPSRDLSRRAQRRAERGLPSKGRLAWLAPTPGLRDWRTQMRKADLEMFEAIAGDLLAGLHYERAIDRTSSEVAQMAESCSNVWREALVRQRKNRSGKPAERASAVGAAGLPESVPALAAPPHRDSIAPAGIDQVLGVLRNHGYVTADGNFPTGRPDRVTVAMTTRAGLPVVAKWYPSGGGHLAYANMREVWRSSFGERRRPPGLPRPVEYLPDPGILIMERVEGHPLAERRTSRPEVLDEVVGLLASLHESDARPVRRRHSQSIVRSIQRKAENLRTLAPDLAEMFYGAARALEEFCPADRELVPSHGDFSPRNVFLSSDRLMLIDWDRFQSADPARDVAYMGLWCWASNVRQAQRPEADWSVLERTATRYDSLRPDAAVRERLHFHIAAGLIRIAHSIVQLWPAERSVVPELIQEALRRLRNR